MLPSGLTMTTWEDRQCSVVGHLCPYAQNERSFENIVRGSRPWNVVYFVFVCCFEHHPPRLGGGDGRLGLILINTLQYHSNWLDYLGSVLTCRLISQSIRTIVMVGKKIIALYLCAFSSRIWIQIQCGMVRRIKILCLRVCWWVCRREAEAEQSVDENNWNLLVMRANKINSDWFDVGNGFGFEWDHCKVGVSMCSWWNEVICIYDTMWTMVAWQNINTQCHFNVIHTQWNQSELTTNELVYLHKTNVWDNP